MERDSKVFCIGEDIAVPGGWGGAFTVTLGLEKKFPDRMIDTPIAELGFFGIACGAAMMGMRPIADVQYGDFLYLACDQIIDNIAKMRLLREQLSQLGRLYVGIVAAVVVKASAVRLLRRAMATSYSCSEFPSRIISTGC